MRPLIILFVLSSRFISAQESALFCAQFVSQGEPMHLLEAQDGLYSTAGDLQPGSSYYFEVSVLKPGFLYVILEGRNGRLKVRKIADVNTGEEPLRQRIPDSGMFLVDDTGNRDQVAILFSSSPHPDCYRERRMLQRTLRRASGNFINKVRATIKNTGVTFYYEGCFAAMVDSEIVLPTAVMIVSIDKK